MNYKKVYPKTSLKTVDVLTSDGALNFGCYMENGKIVSAINSVKGLKSIQQKPTVSWYASGPKKYVLFTQNRIYYTNGGMSAAVNVSFNAKDPSMVETFLNSIPVAYVIGDSSYFYLSSNQCYAKPFSGGVRACVLKNGRIFGVDNSDPYKIKWSGEGGIDDWEEGIAGAGWTTVQYGYGEILNLIVYKDKIVVVREHGLTFLTAYGNPENYKLSYFESKLPKIYKNTAAVVGENLLFYTEDGLYFYDGSKVAKSVIRLADEIQSPSTATGGNGKYFLCGTSKNLNKKIIIVFDVIRSNAYIIEVTANTVIAGENIYAYTDSYEYGLDEGGTYTFKSGELDFSSRKEKVLKEVIFNCTGSVGLEVSNGVDWSIVEGVRGKYRPNMRGKSFVIKFYGKGTINGVSAVAEVADGV